MSQYPHFKQKIHFYLRKYWPTKKVYSTNDNRCTHDLLSSLKIVSPWDENSSLFTVSSGRDCLLSKDPLYLGQSVCVCLFLPPSALSASLPSSLGTYLGEGRCRKEKSNENKRFRQNQTHSHLVLKLWKPLIIREQKRDSLQYFGRLENISA